MNRHRLIVIGVEGSSHIHLPPDLLPAAIDPLQHWHRFSAGSNALYIFPAYPDREDILTAFFDSRDTFLPDIVIDRFCPISIVDELERFAATMSWAIHDGRGIVGEGPRATILEARIFDEVLGSRSGRNDVDEDRC